MLTALSMFSPCTQWVFGPLSPVSVGKMVNIFKICVPKMFKYTHRPRTDILYNGPCHVTLMYPNKRSGYIRNNSLNTLERTTIFKM